MARRKSEAALQRTEAQASVEKPQATEAPRTGPLTPPTTEGQFFLQDGKLRYRSSRTTGTAKLSEDKGKTTLSVIADNPDYGKAEYERIRE